MRRAAVFLGLAACAGPPPPAPAPYVPWRVVATEAATASPPLTPSAAPSANTAPLADAAPPATATLVIEPPFKLDLRPVPKEREAFLAELRDRTAWNAGGLGKLVAPVPPQEGHPLPRVIIDVVHATGQVSAADVQRLMRKNYWIRVIDCYSLGAYKDQKLRGEATIKFSIAPGGKGKPGKAMSAKLADSDVVSCLAAKVTSLDFGKAKGMTQVTARIQIGAGDEPTPPPASVVKAGDGALSEEQMRAPLELARAPLLACYERAQPYAPGLWGRLAIRFHVTAKGKVDEAFEVESRFPDEAVARCVLHVARGLRWPAPAGGDLRFIVGLRLASTESVIGEPGPLAPKDPDAVDSPSKE